MPRFSTEENCWKKYGRLCFVSYFHAFICLCMLRMLNIYACLMTYSQLVAHEIYDVLRALKKKREKNIWIVTKYPKLLISMWTYLDGFVHIYDFIGYHFSVNVPYLVQFRLYSVLLSLYMFSQEQLVWTDATTFGWWKVACFSTKLKSRQT